MDKIAGLDIGLMLAKASVPARLVSFEHVIGRGFCHDLYAYHLEHQFGAAADADRRGVPERSGSPTSCACRKSNARTTSSPRKPFRRSATAHHGCHGQKGYHGVAIVSKLPLIDQITAQDYCGVGDKRHISVDFEAGPKSIRLHNFYVPAGGDEPDRDDQSEIRPQAGFHRRDEGDASPTAKPAISSILVGDLNIAPLEHDVWSHKQLLKIVSHTPVETEGLMEMMAKGGWADLMRLHTARAAKALYLVELPRQGLGGCRQGPPARSYLVFARSCAASDRHRDPARSARLGEAIRPCSGDGAVRFLIAKCAGNIDYF